MGLTETVIIAIVTGSGGVIIAVLTLVGVLMKSFSDRLREVEHELDATRKWNKALWFWARRTLDLYYRYRQLDSPEPDAMPEWKDYVHKEG